MIIEPEPRYEDIDSTSESQSIPIGQLTEVLEQRLAKNPNELRAPYDVDLESAYRQAAIHLTTLLLDMADHGPLYIVGSVANSGIKFVGTDIDLQFLGNETDLKRLLNDKAETDNNDYRLSIAAEDINGKAKTWYLIVAFQNNNSVRFYMRNNPKKQKPIKKGEYEHILEMKVSNEDKTVLDIDPHQRIIYRITKQGLLPITRGEDHIIKSSEDGIDKSGSITLRTILKIIKGDKESLDLVEQMIQTFTFRFIDIIESYKSGDESIDYFAENTLTELVKKLMGFARTHANMDIIDKIDWKTVSKIHPILKFFPLISSHGGLDGFIKHILTIPFSIPHQEELKNTRFHLLADEDRMADINHVLKILRATNANPKNLFELLRDNNYQKKRIRKFLETDYKYFIKTLFFDLNFAIFLANIDVTEDEIIDLYNRLATASIFDRYLPQKRNSCANQYHLHYEYSNWQREIVRRRYGVSSRK